MIYGYSSWGLLQVVRGLQEISSPLTEPITTAEAKAQARVDLSDDDTLIAAYIKAARNLCESVTQRAFVSRRFRLTLDAFPGTWVAGAANQYGWDDSIRLPVSPVSSVEAVAYVDTAGDAQTLDASKYQLAKACEPARLAPVYGLNWPITQPRMEAASIDFTAGYGTSADVPEGIKIAVRLLTTHLYETRTPVETSGAVPKEIPFTVESFLTPFMVSTYGY